MIKRNELASLAKHLNRLHKQGGPVENFRPSALAGEALLHKFLPFSQTWIGVYHSRLGIDFEEFKKWTTEIFTKVPIISTPQAVGMMRDHFLSYIFLVDTIITIIPQPEDHFVQRIQAFRMAVTCFERYTEEQIAKKLFKLDIYQQKASLLWSYIEYWLTQDLNYKSNSDLWSKNSVKTGSKLCTAWKIIFNLIFAYSIDSLNTEKETELLKKGYIFQDRLDKT
jgi:hypothetical protein